MLCCYVLSASPWQKFECQVNILHFSKTFQNINYSITMYEFETNVENRESDLSPNGRGDESLLGRTETSRRLRLGNKLMATGRNRSRNRTLYSGNSTQEPQLETLWQTACIRMHQLASACQPIEIEALWCENVAAEVWMIKTFGPKLPLNTTLTIHKAKIG